MYHDVKSILVACLLVYSSSARATDASDSGSAANNKNFLQKIYSDSYTKAAEVTNEVTVSCASNLSAQEAAKCQSAAAAKRAKINSIRKQQNFLGTATTATTLAAATGVGAYAYAQFGMDKGDPNDIGSEQEALRKLAEVQNIGAKAMMISGEASMAMGAYGAVALQGQLKSAGKQDTSGLSVDTSAAQQANKSAYMKHLLWGAGQTGVGYLMQKHADQLKANADSLSSLTPSTTTNSSTGSSGANINPNSQIGGAGPLYGYSNAPGLYEGNTPLTANSTVTGTGGTGSSISPDALGGGSSAYGNSGNGSFGSGAGGGSGGAKNAFGANAKSADGELTDSSGGTSTTASGGGGLGTGFGSAAMSGASKNDLALTDGAPLRSLASSGSGGFGSGGASGDSSGVGGILGGNDSSLLDKAAAEKLAAEKAAADKALAEAAMDALKGINDNSELTLFSITTARYKAVSLAGKL